jgi:transportin-3
MEAKPGAAGGFAPVLTALRTMQSNVAGKDKSDAHEFLEKFQKSVGLVKWLPRRYTH